MFSNVKTRDDPGGFSGSKQPASPFALRRVIMSNAILFCVFLSLKNRRIATLAVPGLEYRVHLIAASSPEDDAER